VWGNVDPVNVTVLPLALTLIPPEPLNVQVLLASGTALPPPAEMSSLSTASERMTLFAEPSPYAEPNVIAGVA